VSIEGISSTQIKQIPPYPDAGVTYAGFSKTIKGQDFKINKQEPINTNANSDQNFAVYTVPRGKAFYLTNLTLQSPGTGTNTLYMTDGTLGAVVGVIQLFKMMANEEITLVFDVPIKFTQFLELTPAVGGAQRIYANATGWIEDL